MGVAVVPWVGPLFPADYSGVRKGISDPKCSLTPIHICNPKVAHSLSFSITGYDDYKWMWVYWVRTKITETEDKSKSES